VIGAPSFHPENADADDARGIVYVFTRSGADWSMASRTGSPDEDGDQFGFALERDGDTVVVGAPGGVADPPHGAAYVLTLDGGELTLDTKLPSPTGVDYEDRFGNAVAIDGDRAVIGAPVVALSNGVFRGQANVYERTDSGWTESGELTPQIFDDGQEFGKSVALWEDTVVVAGYDLTQSRTYVYDWTGDAWEGRTPRGLQYGNTNELGRAIAMVGPRALIGAPTQIKGGTVYVVHTNPSAEITVEDQDVARDAPTLTVARADADIDFYLSVLGPSGGLITTTDPFDTTADQRAIEVPLYEAFEEETAISVVVNAVDDTELAEDEATLTPVTEATTAAPSETTATVATDSSSDTPAETTAPSGEASDDDAGEDDEDDSSSGSPGFGVGGAAAALGAAAYLAKRRLGTETTSDSGASGGE